jgi:1-deoxyxylulose-5-phosphate synthase
MDYVNLGKTGLKVSRICLGMLTFGSRGWRDYMLPEEEARPIVRRAVELGVTFFDTANVYSAGVSEQITGRLLKECFGTRDEYVLATKVCEPMGEKPNQSGLSRKHILESVDASLRRLGVDHVDLYQIHRPDPSTPIEETLEALHDVIKAGKARYIGASCLSAWQFAKALYTAELHQWTRFVSIQNQYNLIYREEEREMIPFCIDEGIGVIPWSPLARGFLTGTRTSEKGGETLRSKSDAYAHSMYYQKIDFEIVDRVAEVAGRLGVSRAQVALAWMLHKPAVTSPIVGVTKLRHLEEAIASLTIKLTPALITSLEELYQPKQVHGLWP